jgi:hypothetical protein
MNWFSGLHGLSVSPMRGAARYRGSKRKCCDATALEVWAYPIEEHARRRLANHIGPKDGDGFAIWLAMYRPRLEQICKGAEPTRRESTEWKGIV